MKRVIFVWAALAFSTSAFSQSVSLTSSKLPIVVLTTGGILIPDEPKVLIDMGIIDNGPGTTNLVTDPFNAYNGKVGIEMRGSSSQFLFPKKQYAVELRDAAGFDIEQSILGLPIEGDWILFAPYNDKTLMRDAVAYDLTRSMGRYASRTKYCEVVLDGEYMGVYVLLEKIKRSEFRVDIAKLEPGENSGDDLTGGYILKIDKTSGGSGGAGFDSQFPPINHGGFQTIYLQYEYPKVENITLQQKAYIKDFMDAFESSLHGSDFTSPTVGYRNYIDVPSFIDFQIMNELTKNADGYRLSTFMYKDKDSNGGKLHMGPVWDFNLGFGNVNYCTGPSPIGFVTDFNYLCNGDFWLIPFWWSRLMSDHEYRAQLDQRWTELRSGPLATAKVLSHIDSIATVLNDGPQQRNFQKWPVLGTYVWPNPPETQLLTTFDEEVTWLKSWVATRLHWLDDAFHYVVTGTEDEDTGTSIKPYPNPFGDKLSFEYSIAEPGNVSIQVHDALGREVASIREYHQEAGTFTTTPAVESIASGLYFYKMEVNGRACGHGLLSKE